MVFEFLFALAFIGATVVFAMRAVHRALGSAGRSREQWRNRSKEEHARALRAGRFGKDADAGSPSLAELSSEQLRGEFARLTGLIAGHAGLPASREVQNDEVPDVIRLNPIPAQAEPEGASGSQSEPPGPLEEFQEPAELEEPLPNLERLEPLEPEPMAPPPRAPVPPARTSSTSSTTGAQPAASAPASAAAPRMEPAAPAPAAPAPRELGEPRRAASSAPSEELQPERLAGELFATGALGFEAKRIFEQQHKGQRVRWRGEFERCEKYYSDPNLGPGSGWRLMAKVACPIGSISRDVRFVCAFPDSAEAALKFERGAPLVVEGSLHDVNPYMLTFYLIDGALPAG